MSGEFIPLSTSEPVFSTPVQPSPAIGTRRSTLAERRSRDLVVGLSVEAIQESVRGSEEGNDVAGLVHAADDRPASFRGWSVTEEGRSIPTGCPGTVKCMTYNLLAARYVSTDRYRHCPTWALAEDFRSKQICHEVLTCDPDVVAFQEMSIDMHDGAALLGASLREKGGYASQHVVISGKSGAPIHHCPPGGGGGDGGGGGNVAAAGGGDIRREFEGVAIFYKTSRYRLLETAPIRFNLEADKDKTLSAFERGRLQVGSHNVGLVVALQDDRSSEVLVIGTMHTTWDGVQKPECQVWQMHQLLSKVEELKQAYTDLGNTAVIVLGDFNADFTSPCLQYATKNAEQRLSGVAASASNFPTTATTVGTDRHWSAIDTLFEDWKVHPRTHGLLLHSAYKSYCARKPDRVSAVNPSSNNEGKVIDHILFEMDEMVCVSVGRLGARQDLPSKDCPSDHYPLAAILVPLHSVQFSGESPLM